MKTKLIAVPIPAKYKWQATDEDGAVYVYTNKPRPETYAYADEWKCPKGEYMKVGQGEPNPDWRNTLERIVEIEWS